MNYYGKLEKFKEFAEKNKVISERVNSGENYYSKRKYFFRYVRINCPCGKDSLMSEEWECNESGILNEKKYMGEFLGNKLFTHIERKIRLNGCEEHIKIIIEIMGEDNAIRILEFWAKKNILIGLALNKFIQSLKKKKLLCVNAVGGEE